VIAVPPLFAGAAKATDAVVADSVTVTPVGAPGTVAGTKLFDAAEGALPPCVFRAVTLQVYDLPFVRPETTSGLPDPVWYPVAPPAAEQVAV
jgi:hypothetical protein